MEFQPKLVVVHEINLVTKEITKKQINLVPSSTNASFVVLVNIKFIIVLRRTQLKRCLKKR
jgi:hypothetical protein